VRDPIMLVLIAYMFTLSVYVAATAMPETLNKTSIAIVDEDGSPLSARISSAFYPPLFNAPAMIPLSGIDMGMDDGDYTFVLDLPPNFQRDVLAGKSPALQFNVDATRMTQAFTGQRLHPADGDERDQRVRPALPQQRRAAGGPGIARALQPQPGAVLVRRAGRDHQQRHPAVHHPDRRGADPRARARNHRTLAGDAGHTGRDHARKIWSMGLVVLVAAALGLLLIVQGVLRVPVEGSVALFLAGAALDLFAAASMGIFMATLARSMPQFGMLAVLILLPLQLLSGGFTPRESMPGFVQNVMLAAPSTHFVALGQAILFRGAGLGVVWPQFLALAAIARCSSPSR